MSTSGKRDELRELKARIQKAIAGDVREAGINALAHVLVLSALGYVVIRMLKV